MARSINISIVLNHPPEKVWQALANKKAMSEWLMPCDIEAKVGHQFQFKTKPYPGFNGIIDCEILKVEENNLLSFTWNAGSLKNTIVTFQLEALGQKTKLHFEHNGFEGFILSLIHI